MLLKICAVAFLSDGTRCRVENAFVPLHLQILSPPMNKNSLNKFFNSILIVLYCKDFSQSTWAHWETNVSNRPSPVKSFPLWPLEVKKNLSIAAFSWWTPTRLYTHDWSFRLSFACPLLHRKRSCAPNPTKPPSLRKPTLIHSCNFSSRNWLRGAVLLRF